MEKKNLLEGNGGKKKPDLGERKGGSNSNLEQMGNANV